MDLPDAACDRDRGLPLEMEEAPSVRLYIASGLNRDPIYGRDSRALVVVSSDRERPLGPPPASPGITTSDVRMGVPAGPAFPQ